jgi:site-specific DNA-methyltransferase (adenine-specific)
MALVLTLHKDRYIDIEKDGEVVKIWVQQIERDRVSLCFDAPLSFHILRDDAKKRTPNGTVDLVVADPPYGLSKETPLAGHTYPGSSGFGSNNDHTYKTLAAKWDILPDYYAFSHSWMWEAERVLRPSGSLMVFISFHNEYLIRLVGEQLGPKLVSLITLCKKNAPPSITRRQPTPSTEFIVWLSKGKGWTYNREEAKDIGEGKQLRDFWIAKILNTKESRGYRSQKPIEWVERCLRIASHPDELVLDPFLGTGTTLAAAHGLGRRAVGYELNDAAIEIIKTRCKEEAIPYIYQDARPPADPSSRLGSPDEATGEEASVS